MLNRGNSGRAGRADDQVGRVGMRAVSTRRRDAGPARSAAGRCVIAGATRASIAGSSVVMSIVAARDPAAEHQCRSAMSTCALDQRIDVGKESAAGRWQVGGGIGGALQQQPGP